MADDYKMRDEPFFWKKTGLKTENPASEKPKKKTPVGRRAIIQSDRPSESLISSIANDSARAGLQPGWIRASFIVREKYLASLKKKAYWDRRAIKDILDEILEAGLAQVNDSNDSETDTKEKK